MKVFGILFSVCFSFLAANSVMARGSEDYPVRFCGTIFAVDPSLQNGPIHIASKAEDGTVLFDLEIYADSTQASNELAKVVAPNDQYIGCVGAEEGPFPGFQVLALRVKLVELKGQTTGFSIGK
jgi:hypothetical protein